MFTKLKDNQSGIILVTVLIIVIVLSILAVGILSMGVTRVKSGTGVVHNIQAEYFARELLWEIYANDLNGEPIDIVNPITKTIDGKLFTATIAFTAPNQYQIDVSY